MFSMRHIVEFAPVMADAAVEMIERWRMLGEGAEINAADEMMRLTYDIISAARCLLQRHDHAVRQRCRRRFIVYLETQGRVDILRTIWECRNWVPTPEQSSAPRRRCAVFPQVN